MSAVRKMAVYLGLVEDFDRTGDRYDEYGEPYDDADPTAYGHEDRPEPAHATAAPSRRERREAEPAARASASVAQLDQRRPAPVTPARPAEVRITTLHPRTYNEARTIGEHFRDGIPVIMNLGEMDDGHAQRLVDFAAGLVFGVRGSIERVSSKVFLLSPADVHVTAEDKARIAEGGFFNQS